MYIYIYIYQYILQEMSNLAHVVTYVFAGRYGLKSIRITISRTNESESIPCTATDFKFHRRHDTKRIMCIRPIIGRYVKLAIHNKGANKLTLCEVEVYGTTLTGKLYQYLITDSSIVIVF